MTSAFLAAHAHADTGGEHVVQLVIDDNVESARRRLMAALQKLDYLIVSDDPLLARYTPRAASRLTPSFTSFDLLNKSRKLTIGLRPFDAETTLATFDYTIVNSEGTGSYKAVLEREAEALVALAKLPLTETKCGRCGLEATGDSHFCRGCGVPLAHPEPTELVLLKFTAETRAVYMKMIYGGGLVLFPLLLLLVMFLSGEAYKMIPVIILFAAVGLFGASMMLSGLWLLHRMLITNRDEHKRLASTQRHDSPKTSSIILPQGIGTSITEGTTELLMLTRRVPDPVPVKRHEGTIKE